MTKPLQIPGDYAEARARFWERAKVARWTMESFPISVPGPLGETLSIDAASSPGADDLPLVLLTSGLHGVEGPFGSAAQLAMLDECERSPSILQSVRIVLVHALNPFGFAWRRRFDQLNVDLNRSFRAEDETFSGCSEIYRSLDSFLNPRRPPSAIEPYRLKAVRLVARYGLAALQQAIAEGQYELPRGMFFGGTEVSETQRILQQHWSRWLGRSVEIIHLDFHTGLGPRGLLQMMPESPLDGVLARRLQALKIGLPTQTQGDVAYEVRGSFGAWSARQARDRDVVVVCVELGTESAIAVLGGLRAENQAHHWGASHPAVVENSKSKLARLFCPTDARWRQHAAEQTRHLLSELARAFVR